MEEIVKMWLITATVAAFFIKGLCGFANTLVFSTILSFVTDNINITPVELILGYPSNVIITWKERKSVEWKVCLPLALLVLLGNIPGIILLKQADTRVVKLIFGVVIVCVGLEMFLRERRAKAVKQSRILLILIGIFSGVLCGLYGIGALLAAYMGRVTENSREFKANICVVFIVENTFRIIMYAYLGIINLVVVKRAVRLVPFMLVGLFAGMLSGKVLDEKRVKKAIIVMLILSGAALVVNNR